jgi:hypothetical protein
MRWRHSATMNNHRAVQLYCIPTHERSELAKALLCHPSKQVNLFEDTRNK